MADGEKGEEKMGRREEGEDGVKEDDEEERVQGRKNLATGKRRSFRPSEHSGSTEQHRKRNCTQRDEHLSSSRSLKRVRSQENVEDQEVRSPPAKKRKESKAERFLRQMKEEGQIPHEQDHDQDRRDPLDAKKTDKTSRFETSRRAAHDRERETEVQVDEEEGREGREEDDQWKAGDGLMKLATSNKAEKSPLT
eukprot:746345-Hanusia_phi.AAC.1